MRVGSFKNIILIFELKSKVSRVNLNANKRILKIQPFLHDHSRKATEQHFPIGLFITQSAQGGDYTFQPADKIFENSKKSH